MQISKFRADMIKFSQEYPFVTKVTITEEAWEELCKSFDRDLNREEGETAAHIKEKNGWMKFDTAFVEAEKDV